MMYQPWLTSPMRASLGTRTSSKKTSLVRPPDIVMIGRTEMPGVSIGTMKVEMPRCLGASGSVRQASQTWEAVSAALVQSFWPLMSQSSPSFTARVSRAARSVPALGSE